MVNIAYQLAAIERDRQLRERVDGFVKCLQGGESEEYVNIVQGGLTILAEKYLAPWIRQNIQPHMKFALLLSYHSIGAVPLPHSPYGPRIMMRSAAGDPQVGQHVTASISGIFRKIRESQEFSMHDFARRRLRVGLGRDWRRVPVVLTPLTSSEPAVDDDYFPIETIRLAPLEAGLTPLVDSLYEQLVAISSRQIDGLTVSKGDLRVYAAYLAFLLKLDLGSVGREEQRELLGLEKWQAGQSTPALREGLALLTIPISEELTEVDLGTLMIFFEPTGVEFRGRVAWELNRQAMEFMNALWRHEHEESRREEVIRMRAVSASHEAGIQLSFVRRTIDYHLAERAPRWLLDLLSGAVSYSQLSLESHSRLQTDSLPWTTQAVGVGVGSWLQAQAEIAWRIALARECVDIDVEELDTVADVVTKLSLFPGELLTKTAGQVFVSPPNWEPWQCLNAGWNLLRWYLVALSNAMAWSGPFNQGYGFERMRLWASHPERFRSIVVTQRNAAHGSILRIRNGFLAPVSGTIKDEGTKLVLEHLTRQLSPRANFWFRQSRRSMNGGPAFETALYVPWRLA